MGVSISYMGTKRELAPAVADVISSAKSGPVLDVFSGMCSVGEAIAPSRQVWTNDAQIFAAEVGAALFTSDFGPPSESQLLEIVAERFRRRQRKMSADFAGALAFERELLEIDDFEKFTVLRGNLRTEYDRETSRSRLRSHTLFVSIYADTFFGIGQAIEIDSILNAIANARVNSGSLSSQDARWLLVALGRAMLRCANSTGHFARSSSPRVGRIAYFRGSASAPSGANGSSRVEI